MTDPVTQYQSHYQQLDGRMRRIKERVPGPMQGFTHLHQAAVADGALDSKAKELIALAIGVATRSRGCIFYHLRDALTAGASPEEIADAIGVAVLMGGAPATIYGAEAIELLERLESNPKE